MPETFKVWIEIECIDEPNDEFETLTHDEAGEFDNLADAETFAEGLAVAAIHQLEALKEEQAQ